MMSAEFSDLEDLGANLSNQLHLGPTATIPHSLISSLEQSLFELQSLSVYSVIVLIENNRLSLRLRRACCLRSDIVKSLGTPRSW